MDEDSRSTDSPGQSQPGTPQQASSHSPGGANLAGMVPGEGPRHQQSKYTQLLAVIEELGRDIRPTYAGSKSSAERLKRGIVHARILVRECLMETERNARS
uniref:Putative cyclin-dependent kinase 2-associated protein n=2 Tax=Ixodes TaxID=6944 RepID=V5I4Z2_IXORI